MAAAPPRVAVVGGGIAGSLCALVLRSRGAEPVIFDMGKRSIGGRFGQLRKKRSRGDEGAQFICAPADEGSQFAKLLRLLMDNRIVEPWHGRFGLLGSKGGGFLPKEIISSTVLGGMKQEGDDQEASLSNDGDDFCGFIRCGSKASELLVGVPSMSNVCEEICSIAKLDVHRPVRITDVQLATDGYWSLLGGGDADERICSTGFHAVALASHDPSLAVKLLQRLSSETRQGTFTRQQPEDLEKLCRHLADLAKDLQVLRDKNVGSVFTLAAAFPAQTLSSAVPFDAASCPNSPHFQFIVREGSKPGRRDCLAADEELWTAISTASYARELAQKHRDKDAVANDMSHQLLRILSPHLDKDAPWPMPLWSSARHWRAGFSTKTLGLSQDCLSLEPWRLAICGDFFRNHTTPVEAAALSGMEAGERIASWLSSSPT